MYIGEATWRGGRAGCRVFTSVPGVVPMAAAISHSPRVHDSAVSLFMKKKSKMESESFPNSISL
jgi:hypothetical protein